MVLPVHILSWLWLMLMVILGLTRQTAKSANRYLILSRLGYLALIITGVYLSTKTFTGAWLLTSLKALLGLGTIGLIEVAFARRQESRLTPRLVSLLVVGIVLTVAVGWGLHWTLTGQWF
ncbi:DUF1516 family protein [Lactiplantibacillus daowaiensis]|uniref:DUF1516 family protein n=1 Tax=Lactiplantibacillus daowaiensis TaxID=2559918 RepID=A0ABW1RX38_9LACO|nr:DUF1516 family protein [Lactiplantibacillus daowaiensis]